MAANGLFSSPKFRRSALEGRGWRLVQEAQPRHQQDSEARGSRAARLRGQQASDPHARAGGLAFSPPEREKQDILSHDLVACVTRRKGTTSLPLFLLW